MTSSFSFAFVTPIVTSVSLGAVVALCARSRHTTLIDADVYRFPKVLGYLMSLVGAIFLGAAFLPGMADPGDGRVMSVFWIFSPFWMSAGLAAIYFFRFRIVVTKESVAVRSIRSQTIEFSEVADVASAPRRSKELLLYLRDGRCLRFSSLLQDFDGLRAQIESNAPRHPGQSPARLRDEARDKENGVRERRVLAGGLLILALGLGAVWLLA